VDADAGRESPYPRPLTARWGVGLFTAGAILSCTDRQILAILLQGAAFAVLLR
jgi:hypothetical protein